jgi:hypothetical protein
MRKQEERDKVEKGQKSKKIVCTGIFLCEGGGGGVTVVFKLSSTQ